MVNPRTQWRFLAKKVIFCKLEDFELPCWITREYLKLINCKLNLNFFSKKNRDHRWWSRRMKLPGLIEMDFAPFLSPVQLTTCSTWIMVDYLKLQVSSTQRFYINLHGKSPKPGTSDRVLQSHWCVTSFLTPFGASQKLARRFTSRSDSSCHPQIFVRRGLCCWLLQSKHKNLSHQHLALKQNHDTLPWWNGSDVKACLV